MHARETQPRTVIAIALLPANSTAVEVEEAHESTASLFSLLLSLYLLILNTYYYVKFIYKNIYHVKSSLNALLYC